MELAAGVVGVAGAPGVFTAPVRLLGMIVSAYRFKEDYADNERQFSNLKLQLVLWRIIWGYGRPGGHDRRLDEPMLRKLIMSTFESIQSKLRDVDHLESRYNRPSPHVELQVIQKIEHGVSQKISFSESINSVLENITGLGDPVTWALMGKKDFDKLLGDLRQDSTRHLAIPEQQEVLPVKRSTRSLIRSPWKKGKLQRESRRNHLRNYESKSSRALKLYSMSLKVMKQVAE